MDVPLITPGRARASDDSADAVLCPLCDYDLRGLTEPRCPECGFRFAWAELLDPKRGKHPYLFEHHPERNFTSFWRTAWGGFNPSRFWRSFHPAQPSRPRRLVLYWCLAAGAIALASAGDLIETARALMAPPIIPTNAPSPTAPLGGVWFGPGFAVPSVWQAFGTAIQTRAFSVENRGLIILPLAWPWLTAVILLAVFRFSMRHARVRRIHVLRCVLYSFDVVLWLGLAKLLLLPVGFGAGFQPGLRDPRTAVQLLLTVGMGCLGAWRLCRAYEHYLRFDHPLATIFSSQLICLLLYFAAEPDALLILLRRLV